MGVAGTQPFPSRHEEHVEGVPFASLLNPSSGEPTQQTLVSQLGKTQHLSLYFAASAYGDSVQLRQLPASLL